MFSHNAVAPTEGGGASLLPAGTYKLVITKVEEKKSKAGNDMVNVTLEVQNNAEFNGAKVFHNVTFLPADAKGAGMSSHFLKCINQPYEGAITVNPEAWVGERIEAKIAPREYKKQDGSTAKTNNIVEVKATDAF